MSTTLTAVVSDSAVRTPDTMARTLQRATVALASERRARYAFVLLASLTVFALPQSASAATPTERWQAAAASLEMPVLQPRQTRGLRLKSLNARKIENCGRTKEQLDAFYGNPRRRFVAVLEAKPVHCELYEEVIFIRTVLVHGKRARLYHPVHASRSYALFWRERGIAIFLSSGRVAAQELLAFARSMQLVADPNPQCSDGLDNDGDGKTDHPADPGCTEATDSSEADLYDCSDGVDNDDDGLTDYPADPGCSSAADTAETTSSYQCDDGSDNDTDGFTDYPDDSDCSSPTDGTEGVAGSCDPAYPGVCIPPPPPDLDCGDINYTNFTVLPPDPHNFDGNHDGVGCET